VASEEARRTELVRERDTLGAVDQALDLTQARVVRAIRARAADIRASLLEHRAEARDVLHAFLEVITFTRFGKGRARGYDFDGDGDHGALFGQITARAGDVPEGTTPTFP
jgi:hypothetical protein